MLKKLHYVMASTLLLFGTAAQAATTNFDFNSDPSGFLDISGNAFWSSSGGVGSATNPSDGFLVITTATGSQRGQIIFDDFDAGSVVQGFTFDCDLRIGNGTANPADGFSVNYCRANDPVLSGGDYATGPDCGANLPEEGTQTGIAVGFDAWRSGGTAPFCNEADQSIGEDIIAVSVRVDGILVLQAPMTTQNGACGDFTSLQTGPYDGTGSDANLCWAHLKVQLGIDGKLNVFWKGHQILTDFQTSYFPSPSRLVFCGRTGGSYQNQEIDNISITTVEAALALVGPATGFADGFSITVSDSGNSVVNPASVTTKLNNVSVTPTSVTKTGATTTILYHAFPTLFPIGVTNTVFVSCLDTNGNTISGTKQAIVPSYTALAAADAVTGVNTALPGVNYLPWQSAGEPNAVYWMLEQLSGLHGANNAAFTTPQSLAGVINFNITPASVPGGGDAGNFQTNNGYADSLFPGIPGGNGLNGSTAVNINCFLRFQTPGLYVMGVNSDDGFLVSEGKNPNDWFANWLGNFNGGRGASDTTFTIAVTNAGIYPVRLAWENGNGEAGNGANLEWFTIKNGVKILVNDPSGTNTSGITPFYSGPALPAFVSAVEPNPGSTGNRADTLSVQITDVGTSLVQGSVHLFANGVQKSPVLNHVGQLTTITLNLPFNDLLPIGLNQFGLTWSDSGGAPHSNYWTFSVASYVTLDPSLGGPIGSQDLSQPGFLLRVTQVDPCIPNAANPAVPSDCGDGTVNNADSANAMIAGLYFPWYGTNAADIWDIGTGGFFPAVDAATGGNTWYWTNVVDFNPVTSPGDFGFDYALPGVPTVNGVANRPRDSFAGSFDTYLLFTNAGYHVMAVSSDDNFRLTESFGIPHQILHVSGASVSRDVAAVPSTPSNAGGVWKAQLPSVPLTAPIVYVDSTGCPGPTTMDLTGKIALIDANRCGNDGADGSYNNLVSMCQARGAVGVIVQASPGWGTPEVMTGGATNINIPAVHINGYNGEKDWFHTNGPLVATIQGDTSIRLGESDPSGGRGMGWVNCAFVVPQPGLYPMHLIWEQGGGGAGLEWASVATDGTRTLVNDGTVPGAVMAFRAVTVPRLSIAHVGNNYVITYTGVLRSSPTVTGTFNIVPGATSPYTIPSTAAPMLFYRASTQ